MDFRDKVVIITGSGRGIGAATAKMFAAEQAKIVVNDLNAENAQQVVDEITANGGVATSYIGNISEPEHAEKLIATAVEAHGTVHILVNNAGYVVDKLVGDMELEDWEVVLNACLRSTFLCTKFASKYMIENQFGKIVNISSRAYLGNPGQANYSAAKAGVVGFTKAMAKELGKYSINVNAIAPGLTETEALLTHPKYDLIKANAQKAVLLRRLGQPNDIANAILFLASEKSSYITGDVLHVTGGRFS